MLDAWHLGVLVLVINAAPVPVRGPHYCPAQIPPLNPTAAGPDGTRVLSRVGAADHLVTPKAPWTGSGCREYSCGGFGEATYASTRMPRSARGTGPGVRPTAPARAGAVQDSRCAGTVQGVRGRLNELAQ